jgi:hypothetical protein
VDIAHRVWQKITVPVVSAGLSAGVGGALAAEPFCKTVLCQQAAAGVIENRNPTPTDEKPVDLKPVVSFAAGTTTSTGSALGQLGLTARAVGTANF